MTADEDLIPPEDPRVKTWFLMNTPWPTITAISFYVMFVKVIGPNLMKNRKPYNLNELMQIYNIIAVLVNAWIFVRLGVNGWFGKYSWWCEPLTYGNDEESLKVVEACWYFFLSKFMEFFDTIFFVLRKKHSQASFLHIFHHSIVPLTTWYGVKRGASGFNSIFVFLNSFVHIWMYMYYALASLGPKVQRHLWWKKYLTVLQMVQFSIVLAIMGYMVISSSCLIPIELFILNAGQAILFLGLFLNFYITAYREKISASTYFINGHCKAHVN